jgi:hypothetical protein
MQPVRPTEKARSRPQTGAGAQILRPVRELAKG